MIDRKKRITARNKMMAYIAAGVVHAVIIGSLVFNFASKPKSIEADFAEKVDVVKATTVDESEIRQKQEELRQKDLEERRQKEAERKQRQEEREREEKKIEDLKKQQQEEKKKAEELEQQRKEIALKKQQEDEKRRQEEEARKKREAEAAKKREQDRIRQQELDRIKREEEELAARREMNERLAREEAMIAQQRAQERATTLASKYAALIKQRVQPKITISPDFAPTLSTRMNVKLSPSGVVSGVRIIESSGNSAYDRAVETAIYAASPLPIPSRDEDPEVNRMFQDLTLNFSIDGR